MRRDGLHHPILPECGSDCTDRAITPSFPICDMRYVLVLVGKDHPLADCRGYAYRHRLVAWERAGGHLPAGTHVHHGDERPGSDDPSNLEVLTLAQHRARHRKADRTGRPTLREPGEPDATVACACGCGATFPKFDRSHRARKFISGHNVKGRRNNGS